MNTREAIARAVLVLEEKGGPRDQMAAERLRQVMIQKTPSHVARIDGVDMLVSVIDVWIDE